MTRRLLHLLGLACLIGGLPPECRGAEEKWIRMRDSYNGLFLQSLVPPSLEYSTVRWQPGDDPRWARKDWDDSSWAGSSRFEVPSHTGIFWIRFRVRNTAGRVPPGFYIQATMAYEIFWDEQLIGRSGVPGNSAAEERTGDLDNVFSLPDAACAPGEHQVSLRVSNYANRFPAPTMPFRFVLVAPADYQDFSNRSNLGPAMVMGASLMLALTAIVMWLVAARRGVLLLLALMCLCAAVTQGMLVARFVFGYRFEWHFWAWMAQGISATALGSCLLALVIFHYQLPRWLWVLVVLPMLMVIPTVHVGLPLYLALALGAALWAAGRRRRGAWLVVAGLGITLGMWLVDPVHLLSSQFVRYFLPTLLGLTVAVALDIREERRQAEKALLTSARLEVELLKKNIQPHFLLNSLASLLEVIEQTPREAGPLIEALAGEFRILARVSGEKLISLGQELELCDCHLRVMSMRQGTSWRLERTALDADLLVPPAIFHTLIENGITHSEGRPRHRTFHLRAETRRDVVRFTLLAPNALEGPRNGPPSAGNGASGGSAPGREGTGMRYVKARLEESFPGRWSLRAGPTAEGWQTSIEVHQRN